MWATTPPRRNSDLRQLEVARGAVEHHQPLAADLGQLDRAAARKAVLRIAHQHQLVLVQRKRVDVRVAQRAHQPDLDLVVEHHRQDLFGVAGAHGDVDARVQIREALQHGRQHVRAHRRRGAQRQPSRAGRAQVGQRLATVVDRLHGALGARQEHAPGVGQPHAAAGAHEERLAELLFERLDARGQRRLGDVQRLGGAADVAGAGDFDECLDLAEQHGSYQLQLSA